MTECKLWDGPVGFNGRYGVDTIDGISTTAHRAAWIRANGPIEPHLVVCHKCDNPLCVNLAHLFVGTQSENMQDCKRKNRLARHNQAGQANGNAKPNLVERYRAVKRDRELGLTYRELKQKHGIKSNGHLRNILVSEY